MLPGERTFAMPAGQRPAPGGEIVYPKEEREAAAQRKNPVAATPESVRVGGELYAVYCTPCHGASGQGRRAGRGEVRPAGGPDQRRPPEGADRRLLAELPQRGGAVMPAYAEALSVEERWHVVNYLRTLAQR